VEAALVGESLLRDADGRSRRLVEHLRGAGTRVCPAPDDALDGLTEGRGLGAIVGLVPMPEPAPIERLLDPATGGRPVLLVAVEVEDPGNVGALCRTALASGAAGLVTVGISDPYHPRAVRTSMGSLFKLPIARSRTLREVLAELRAHGATTVAAVSTGGAPLPGEDPGPGPVAVLVGREAFGLSQEALAAVDRRVSIPMATGVDSFSVNAAAAILLYELLGRG
jgi:TrmH family RNA methyltransferase